MKLQERVVLFQQRLQQVITDSGLNRSAFSASISVDRSTLSQLLSPANVRLPRADTVASIAEIHQVSIDWLLGLTQSGSLSPDIVPEYFQVGEYSNSVFERLDEWHKETIGYKIRYVPTTFPDLLKTEKVIDYQFNRYGSAKTDHMIRQIQIEMLAQRHPGSELEICSSIQALRGFALGQGIWDNLSVTERKAQLYKMKELIREWYPSMRWYLYDEKESYSAPFVIFGPLRALMFMGRLYIMINSTEHILKLTRRFDELIRLAVVHPHEIHNILDGLIESCGS